MKITRKRTFAAALAISTAAAVSLGAQQDRSSAAIATPVLPNYPASPIGVSETQLLQRMSDANILGHLAIMDSVQIVLSDWTVNYSKSDAVTAFAKETDARYRKNLDVDHKLGQETGIGLTTMTGELHRSHIGPSIDSVIVSSDITLDRHYLMSELEWDQHMLGELAILEATARHPAIRDHIAAQIPVIQGELDRARSLAAARGIISKKAQ
ncbi:MAG TPA: DUF4142 domain-containing protein [Gemmatimonadaceae bacterium]|jgi:hypothetical protein|nr:DUF4142 domain-containing protein [Gemmatimonadaceae bacterium]